MNRQDVEARIEDLSGFQAKAVDTTTVRWAADGENMIYRQGRRSYQATPAMVQQATELCQIPVAYAKRSGPDFLAHQLNHWMPQLGAMNMVTKGGELVALSSAQVPLVNPSRVLQKIESTVKPTNYSRLRASADKVEIYAVGESQEAIRKGDIVRGGVYVAFSPIGTFLPHVKGFVERLVCTNGAIAGQDTLVFSFGGDNGDSILKWMGDSLKRAYKYLKPEANRLREMANTKINPSEVIDHVLRSRLPEGVRNQIRACVMDEGAPTLYDLYNHITYVASHEIEDGDVAHRLFERAGTVGEHRSCPVCHHSIQ